MSKYYESARAHLPHGHSTTYRDIDSLSPLTSAELNSEYFADLLGIGSVRHQNGGRLEPVMNPDIGRIAIGTETALNF